MSLLLLLLLLAVGCWLLVVGCWLLVVVFVVVVVAVAVVVTIFHFFQNVGFEGGNLKPAHFCWKGQPLRLR